MNQWMQENALVDVKVNYEWKIARVKRISNDFVEVVLDDSENYKKKIELALIGKLRSVTNLDALRNFAGQFSFKQLEYVERMVFQCDFETFIKNEEGFSQFFRGNLPLFVYALVKSEITDLLSLKDRIFNVFFKVLDLSIKFLQSYSMFFKGPKKSSRDKNETGRSLFETWPEILDICEVLLGKEEFIRNFYEICQYIPNNFQLENMNPGISVFQAIFVDYFIANKGLESLIQLIDSLPSTFSAEVFLIFGVDFSFYQKILPNDIKSAFFERISTKFVSISENSEESLVKAEDYSKIFKNFVALIEESQESGQQFEFSYIQIILRAFFSNSLEKRIKGITELNFFIERNSRIIADLELVELINDQNILFDILQKRAHFQILKRAAPVVKFLAKQGKLDENYMKMIQNLENSAEKETSESFQIILEAILPFLSVADQKQFGVLLSFYLEENSSKVFNKELFEECMNSTRDLTRMNKTLKKISEIVLLPENLSLKESFLQVYPILVNDMKSSYSYLRLMIYILQGLAKNELNESHKRFSLYSSTIENLSNYLKYYQNFCKGSGVVLKVPHEDQVLIRFEILEYMMEKSSFLISRSSQKKLLSMCLYQTDDKVKNIYQKSIVSGNVYANILTEEDSLIKLFSDESFIKTYSIYSFRVFKHIFLKINENSSLFIENSPQMKKKLVCVLNRDIKARDILFQLFYISKNNELGKIKVLIRNLLSCYSFEAIETCFSIFRENLDLLKSFHNPGNPEDVYKFIGILHDILCGVTESTIGSKVVVLLIFPSGNERFEVSENTNVIFIRKYLCSRLKNDLAEVSFRIADKVYTCHDNSVIVKLRKDMEIFYVPQQTMLEIVNSEALLEELKDYKEFCWKLVVCNKKFSKSAFDIAKKLGCSEMIQLKVVHFDLKEEDFKPENLFISVQIVYQLYFYFCYEKDLEKAKNSEGLKIALKGMSSIIDLPQVQNEFTGYILSILNISLRLKNFDSEAVLKLLISTLNWLINNLNSSKFSETFDYFTKVWHEVSENIEEQVYSKRISQYMIENFKEILEKCSLYEKDNKEVKRFAEYLRFFLHISSLFETFLSELNENYFELIRKGGSNYLQIIFKSILNALKQFPERVKFFIESHLRPLLPVLNETDNKENKNLKLSLEILADYSEHLENFNFKEFLDEFLFRLPVGPNSFYPRCKVNSTRVQGFKFVVEFCKSHPNKFPELLQKINFFNHLKFFRKIDQKFWTISITSVKNQLNGLVGLRNPSSICYSNSLLQQLFHISTFREYILEILPSDSCPLVDSLKLLFTKLQFSFSSTVSGKHLVRVMNNSSNYSDQKDADEYLSNLFTGLLNSKSAQAGLSINLFFSFSQLFEVVPVDCSHKQIMEEIVTCLSIDLTTDSLLKSLKKAFQGELLEHENAYACEKCGRKVRAFRRQSFRTLPNYLIFVLKRFSFDAGSGCRVKLNERFFFDEKLQMNEFLNKDLADLNQCSDFYLKGITLHAGNTDHGHYFSYIKTEDLKWVEFNDGEICDIKKDIAFRKAFGGKNDENSPSAYILIYEKAKTDFKSFQLTGNIRENLKSKEKMRILLKNEEKKLKEIIFSDNYLEFIESLIGLPGTDLICCEFIFVCFIRMSLTDSYVFKIYKKFYETASLPAVEYLVRMISSISGCFELIFFNNKSEARKLIILLIKKYINSFSLDFLYISASGLFSVVNVFHKVKQDAPDSFYEIMNLLLALLEDFCKQEKVTCFYLETLCKKYPSFSSGDVCADSEVFRNENYSNIPQSFKPANISFSYLFLYFSDNLYRMSDAEKENLASEQYMSYFIQQANQKLELITLSQMYANLFENDANAAFNYLIHLLQFSFDRNLKYLKLMSLFINKYNKRVQILHLFLESYVELLSIELDQWSAFMVKYLVKFLRKVKKSHLVDFSQEMLKKISVLVDCYYVFFGKTYDSDKTKRIFEVFENDENQDIHDSDDEIEEKYLKKDMIVYIQNPHAQNTIRSTIIDSIENEILLVKYEESNAVKLIDKSRFDTVQISFRN